MHLTPVFYRNLKAKTRWVVNQGGTSSSKTRSILQLLYLRAQKHNGLHVSVVAETLPHLKRGAIRDFVAMLQAEGAYDPAAHNLTDQVYHVGDGWIEFFGADDASKVRGPRRDVLFVNECNNVPWEVVEQLEVRTRDQAFLDFNAVEEFWAHTRVMTLPPERWTFIKSTYRDNDQLDPRVRAAIEAKQHLPGYANWWRVFGEGEVGVLEGVVLPNWDVVDAFPSDPKWACLGLDFGFTHDPTAVVRVGLRGGELYVQELLYERNLTNAEIHRRLAWATEEVFADAAEPKSIEELARLGLRIKAAEKGPDSIRVGLDILKRYKLHVTVDSVNLIKELRNYVYRTDRLGGTVANEPIDCWNHAIDALRYAVRMKHRREQRSASWMDDIYKDL